MSTETRRPRVVGACPVCNQPATLNRSGLCPPCTRSIMVTVAREAHTSRWDR